MRFYIAVVGTGAACLILPSFISGNIPIGQERLTGVAGQANAMGYIAATGCIAWVSLLITGKNKLRWLFYPLLALTAIRVLVLTGSRGAFIAFVGFFVVVLWHLWHRAGVLVKVLLPSTLLLAVILTARFFSEGAALGDRMALLLQALGIDMGVSVTEEAGVSSRLDLIRQAIGVFKQHPILGAGWGTFRAYSMAVYTHTTPLELLYATGLVGTFLYYYVVVSGTYTLIKGRKAVRDYFGVSTGVAVCLALIAAQLAAGLAIPIINNKIFATVPGIWLGISWHVRALSREYIESGSLDVTSTETGVSVVLDN
jgi:O-antigen ligase